VAGAWLAGYSTALHLAERGYSVVLLEGPVPQTASSPTL